MECSLAKPQADQKSGGSNSQKSGLLPNYPPRVGYGFVGGAYGAVNAGYGASGFGQVKCLCICLSSSWVLNLVCSCLDKINLGISF